MESPGVLLKAPFLMLMLGLSILPAASSRTGPLHMRAGRW